MNVSFCHDTLWDSNLTWYSENPEFTECFQEIVLTITPCIGFWIATAIHIAINWKQTSHFPLPWTFLNVAKLVLCIVLILGSAVELGLTLYWRYTLENIADVYIYAAVSKFITFVLVLLIMIKNYTVGNVTSTLLTLFWLVITICGLIPFRSMILKTFYHDFTPLPKYVYIPEMIYYIIVFCQFLLSFFTDKSPGMSLERKTPFDSSFYSFLTFYWLNNLIKRAQRELLTMEDFPPMAVKLTADYLWKAFESNWKKELQRHKQVVIKCPSSRPHLVWTFVKSLWPWIVLSFSLQIIQNLMVFSIPLLLDLLLGFFTTKEYIWKGYLFAIALFLSQFVPYLIYILMLYFSVCFGLQLRSILSTAIYRKALRLSSATRREYEIGEIVNLVSVDVNKIFEFCSWSTFVIGAPLKLVVAVGFLWMYLGVACLAGIGALVLLIVLSTLISRKIKKLQEKQMALKDSRMKVMTEILNGIKVLKLFAWERPFMQKVTDIRLEELHYIRHFQLLYATYSFLFGCSPFLVAITSFVAYTLISSSNSLTPTIVFVSLNLLNILRSAVMQLPSLTTDVIQMIVSIRRIAKFLASEEREGDEIGNNPDLNEVISIRNASFGWDKEGGPILKDIDFHVPKGSLVAVIGEVGSGKSSLLSSILGETYKSSGSIDVKGKIAYVPQQAWILHQTVKENIIFVDSMNKRKYDDIIKRCSLESDLEILPAGDDTEIGEKGVNLSGGQKQRVSVARAVYHNADIYLFDDPLSAVDAHVGKHIFEHVIGKNGILKDKSRVLVTHNISVLSEADFIITLKDGKIKERGTFEELMNQKSFFAELIDEYLKTETTSDEGSEILSTSAFNRSVSVPDSPIENSEIKIVGDNDAGRLTEEEKMEVGRVKFNVITTYIKHMSLTAFFSMCFGYIANEAFDIGGNIWLSEWSNDKPDINGTYDLDLRNERIGVYAAIGICQAIFIVLGTVATAIGAFRAGRILYYKMLSSVLRSPMSYFDTTPVGRILNRFGRDIDDIDRYIPDQLDVTMFYIILAIGTVILISSRIPLFIPFFVPVSIILYIVQNIYLNISRQIKRISAVTRSPIYSHLTESIQGASSISAYNVHSVFIQKMETKLDTNCLSEFMWTSCVRWLDVRTAILGNVVTLLTSVLGVYFRDHLEPQVMGLLIIYALGVSDTMRFLIRFLTDLENKAVSIERILEYSNLQPEAPWDIPETAPPLQWPELGTVEVTNYSTRYRENLNVVLSDVTLKIADNEKVGIVGRTGAGKSTFTQALFRIIEPVTGAISIDGVDISFLGLHDLRSKLTIIPQDPILFTGSLRINLDPNEDYTDDEVWASLEHSNLKTFVSSLPEGLSHQVAEGGSNLSAGQRQLVCLARALLRKTKILILDEATAAVDVETDSMIQSSIRTQFKHHTVITIAHRLNTIMDYDKIVVMDSGKINEIGSPTELLENKDSLFYSMAKDAGLV